MFSTVALVGNEEDSEAICRFFIQGLARPVFELSKEATAYDCMDAVRCDITKEHPGLISKGSGDGWKILLVSFHSAKGKVALSFITEGKPFPLDYFLTSGNLQAIQFDTPAAFAIVSEDPSPDALTSSVRVTSGLVHSAKNACSSSGKLDSFLSELHCPNNLTKNLNDAKYYAVKLYDPEWLEQ